MNTLVAQQQELEQRERDERPLTANDIKKQVQVIQEVLSAVMIEGTHYGTIPGTGKKKTLLKPGAEKILMTFRMAPQIHVEDLSNDDEVRYRITVNLLNTSGRFLGSGIGEASTHEEKFKWREAVCKEEYEETPTERKRKKWKRGYNESPKPVFQIREEPSDKANTVLKMAKKRAMVDATLTCTAASDIFDQDLDEDDSPRAGDDDRRPSAIKKQDNNNDPRKAAIVARLELVARKGWPEFERVWKETSEEDRKIVGMDFKHLKDLAESVK